MLQKYKYITHGLMVISAGLELGIFITICYRPFDIIQWEFTCCAIMAFTYIAGEFVFLRLLNTMVKNMQVSKSFYDQVLSKLRSYMATNLFYGIVFCPFLIIVIHVKRVRQNSYILWGILNLAAGYNGYAVLSKRDSGAADDGRMRDLAVSPAGAGSKGSKGSKGSRKPTIEMSHSASALPGRPASPEMDHGIKETIPLENSGVLSLSTSNREDDAESTPSATHTTLAHPRGGHLGHDEGKDYDPVQTKELGDETYVI